MQNTLVRFDPPASMVIRAIAVDGKYPAYAVPTQHPQLEAIRVHARALDARNSRISRPTGHLKPVQRRTL